MQPQHTSAILYRNKKQPKKNMIFLVLETFEVVSNKQVSSQVLIPAGL